MRTMYLTNLKWSGTALFASIALIVGAAHLEPSTPVPCADCGDSVEVPAVEAAPVNGESPTECSEPDAGVFG